VTTVRPYVAADEAWAAPLLDEQFGGRFQARAGELLDALALEGFTAWRDVEPIGILMFRADEDWIELFLILAVPPRSGTGTALLDALVGEVRSRGVSRIRLTTTNDNTRAQRFYEQHGFVLVDVRRGAVDEARRSKPTIPTVAADGTPITDELDYELRLSPPATRPG
jgi:GNAT superfamily N-acetyltransferase